MSRFVINVSKNGDRFFSTSRASIGTDADKAREITLAMQAGFPEAAGYKVEVFYIKTTAEAVPYSVGADGLIVPTEALAGNMTFTPVGSDD